MDPTEVRIRRSREVWLPITGYEGLYDVSSLGRVRSLEGRYRTRETPKILKLVVNSHGYLQVTLYKEGDVWTPRVHVLVAEAFLGKKPKGMQIRHLDGDRTNAKKNNLAYGTHADNEQDKVVHGTHARGSRHGNAVLTEDDVLCIKRSLCLGEKQRVIATVYGVSRSTITDIKKDRIWRHV